MEITSVADPRYIPWPWTRNATLFYRYLFRGRPIPRKHDPYPGLASTFLELKRQHPDEIRNLCPRNLHDSKRFRRIPFLCPFTQYFPPVSSSLKTLKRIVEKCSVSGWKRIFLRGLIEWNLESNMIIGNVDTGKASLELDEIVVLKIGGGVLFKFLSLDFIKISFYF